MKNSTLFMEMKYYTLWLIGVITVVFGLQNLNPAITNNFALVSADVLSEPWTILTHMFLHGGFEHYFYNMFGLFLFGLILEKTIGSKRFLMLYFVSGFIAAIGSIIFYDATIGASGAIFGVMGTLAVLKPKMVVWLGYIPMPMVLAAVVWAAGNLIGMFVPSGIASAAHLFGLAFGVAVGFYLRDRFGDEVFEHKHKAHREEEKISQREFETWEDSWM